MRILLCCLLLAACHDDNRLASLETNTGDLAALRAELAALRMQVGALPAMPDVKPIVDRVAALEGQVAKLGAPVKVTHLILRTGEDLGPFVDWRLAYSQGLGGYYECVGTQAYFESGDCSGMGWMPGGPHGLPSLFGGHIVRGHGEPSKPFQVQSVRYTPERCDHLDIPMLGGGWAIEDTGVTGVLCNQDQVSLELR